MLTSIPRTDYVMKNQHPYGIYNFFPLSRLICWFYIFIHRLILLLMFVSHAGLSTHEEQKNSSSILLIYTINNNSYIKILLIYTSITVNVNKLIGCLCTVFNGPFFRPVLQNHIPIWKNQWPTSHHFHERRFGPQSHHTSKKKKLLQKLKLITFSRAV